MKRYFEVCWMTSAPLGAMSAGSIGRYETREQAEEVFRFKKATHEDTNGNVTEFWIDRVQVDEFGNVSKVL